MAQLVACTAVKGGDDPVRADVCFNDSTHAFVFGA